MDAFPSAEWIFQWRPYVDTLIIYAGSKLEFNGNDLIFNS